MNPTIEQLVGLQRLITQSLEQPAIIAGGALRDIWHNRPVKDVDVFLKCYPTKLDQLYKAFMGFAPYKLWKNQGDGKFPTLWRLDSEASEEYDFLVLSGGPTWHGLQMQFVVVDVGDLMADFDIDLCKIYLREGRLVATPEFRRDSFERRITWHLAASRGEEHLSRVMAKYPNFRLRRTI